MRAFARARSLVWFLLVLALAVGLFCAAIRFSRTAAAPTSPPPPGAALAGHEQGGVVCFGTVDLLHGVVALYPLQSGRVVEVLVAENQEVQAGRELLRLEDGIARSKLAEVEAGVKLAQLQLRLARKQPELRRIRVAQQQAMRDAMASRVAAARGVLTREEKLAKSAVITDSDKSINREKIRELEALEQVEAKRLAEIEAQDAEVEIDRAQYELKAAEARRKEAQLALDECRVKAPRPGTVLRILVGPGDVVAGQPNQPAILFAPDDPQVIRATVEQEFASHVAEGKPALVQDETDSSATWRGRVERVAGWYAERRAVLHDPSQLSDVRTLELVIVLEPGQPRLRLGQSVRVFIGSVPP
jgi:multidrug resistance efflux pump